MTRIHVGTSYCSIGASCPSCEALWTRPSSRPQRSMAAATVRAGNDITLISYGRQVHTALAAAEALARESVDAEVIDLRSLVPLDESRILESVARTKHAVVIHEAVRRGGFGAELAAMMPMPKWLC